MALLGDLVVKIVGDTQDFVQKVSQAGRHMSQFDKDMTRIARNMVRAGKALTLGVTVPILGLAAAAIKSAADLELQQAAFETMLGSAERARDLLDDLQTMAAKTPFQMTDLAAGTKTLLAFGTAADDVLPILKQLGDISLGDSQRLKQLALVYGQVQSAGRLMGQDLLQLINVGFNPLQIISQQTGETMAELKKRMEDGAVSAEEVAEAFTIATSEGGLFFGGMERASQTLAGKFSTLTDNVAILGRSFADVLMPALKDIVDWATALVQRWNEMDDSTRRMILQYAAMAASIGPLVLAIGLAIKAFLAIKTAVIALNIAMSANPVIAVTTAIAALVAGISLALPAIMNMRRRHKEYQDQLNNTAQAMSDLTEEEQRNFRQRVSQDLHASIKRMNDLQQEQIALQDSYDEKLAQGIFNLRGGGIAQKALGDAIANTTEELEKERIELERLNNAIIEADKILEADLIANLEDTTEAVEELGDAIGGEGGDADSLFNVLDETFGSDAKWIKAVKEDIPFAFDETFGADAKWVKEFKNTADETFGPDAKWVKDVKDNLEEIQEGFGKTFGRDAKWRKDSKAATEEDAKFTFDMFSGLTGSLSTLFLNLAEQRGATAREQAILARDLAAFEAVVNGAAAVIKALPNIPLAISTGVVAAAQLAAILSTPIPALAQGGIATGPTPAWVGEGGQPEIILPLDQLGDFLSSRGDFDNVGGGASEVAVYLDGAQILKYVGKASEDGRLLIRQRAVV